MSYPIEVKLASKNGWFTPQESINYYGKYNRHGITWHWWGDGTGASNHDNIVNYLLGNAERGQSSVNYVLSDRKITMSVNPDNVAWTSQGGNPVTVSVELQPTLGAEGYKKAGWLASELAARYGGDRAYYPHRYWNSTQCPGTISLDRIRQEEDKWQRGAYNPSPTPNPTPAPTPIPTPIPVSVSFAKITAATYICNKQPTHLYQVNTSTWKMGVVKSFNKGDKIDIYGVAKNSTLGSEHYITKYSYDNKLPNGFSKADLDLFVAPAPAPAPSPVPQPTIEYVPIAPATLYTLNNAKLVNIKDMSVVKTFPLDTPMEIVAKVIWERMEFYVTKYGFEKKTGQGFLVGDLKMAEGKPDPEPVPEPTPAPVPDPEAPEWVKNLRDIDDTEFWFKNDQKLIDIATGKPALNHEGMETTFEKDESFVCSALTVANGVEYRITDYSFKKGIFNGVPIGSLTLTEPGVPDIDPIPVEPGVDKNVVIAFLEMLGKLISDFIAKIKG